MTAKTPTTGRSKSARNPSAWRLDIALNILYQRVKKMKPTSEWSPEELLRFIVGIVLSLTLTFIVATVLYSLVFVSQPMEGQSPNDAEFFKLINPIATFIVGALAGLMAGQGSGSRKPKKTEGE
jgi:hypothetical protein